MSIRCIGSAFALALLSSCGLITAEPAGQAVEERRLRFEHPAHSEVSAIARQFSTEFGYEFREGSGSQNGLGRMIEMDRGQLVIVVSNPFQLHEYIITGYCGKDCEGNAQLSRSVGILVERLRTADH